MSKSILVAGLDLSDAILAITELARYHALGMAMKYNRPADFEKAREPMAVFPFHLGDNEFDDVTDHLLEMIDTEPRMAKYAERAKRCINADRGWKSIQSTDAVEPWITITHGDFWINNIMFHKGEWIFLLFNSKIMSSYATAASMCIYRSLMPVFRTLYKFKMHHITFCNTGKIFAFLQPKKQV